MRARKPASQPPTRPARRRRRRRRRPPISATYAVLSAPFDGIVTERHADPGSMATPGTPLLALEDPATYRLEVQLDEARAALVTTGQTVSVRLDNAPGAGDGWINGRVAEIARVDPASHSVCRQDRSADVRVVALGTVRARPVLRTDAAGADRARSALINRGQLTFVYVVDGEETSPPSADFNGRVDHDRTEVLAGLARGDAIVDKSTRHR